MTDTELVRDFVNTRELLPDSESLDSPEALGAWLSSNGIAGRDVRPTSADLDHAVELREALRAILLTNTGVEVDTGPAFGVLDEVASRAHIQLRFDDGRDDLRPEVGGAAGALGRIAIAVHAAMADGSWPLLKACRARDCEWAFIDTAKNHSRTWCSMESCGNREKARLFRERHRH
jgi:predicted RNA-binding Zn ribbon-like protein